MRIMPSIIILGRKSAVRITMNVVGIWCNHFVAARARAYIPTNAVARRYKTRHSCSILLVCVRVQLLLEMLQLRFIVLLFSLALLRTSIAQCPQGCLCGMRTASCSFTKTKFQSVPEGISRGVTLLWVFVGLLSDLTVLARMVAG